MPEKDILAELSKDPLFRQTAVATDELIGSDFVEQIKENERAQAEEDADMATAGTARSLVPNGAPVNTPNGPIANTPPPKVPLPEELIEQRNRKYQEQIAGALRNTDAWLDKSKNWSKPYGFNTGESDIEFDRYYASTKAFKKFGYSPFRDNDALYNANNSWWDDFNRMRSVYFSMYGEAIVQTAKQWEYPFDFEANTKFSAEHERNMRIGTSTKEGLGAKFTNLVGNSSFTLGILSEMIMEGIVASTVGTALNVSGVGTAAGLGMQSAYIAKSAANLRRIFGIAEGVKNMEKAASIIQNTNKAWRSMDSIEKVRNLWDTSRKIGTTGLKTALKMPLGLNTVEFGKNFIQGAKGVDKLNDFALMRKGVGSLYMDIREMNFAISESRMEGGSVTNNLVRDLNQEYYLKHGKMAEGADAERIAEIAFKAGNKTTLINAPIIYLTNKLVFGKAFRGFTPAAVVRRELGEAGADLIIDESRRAAGKAVAEVVKGPKKYLMTSFWKQAPLGATANLLRYTQANWSEGAQESIQDVIARGTEEYYNQIYHDPAMAGNRQAWAAFEGGVKSQFSGQGAETFLSGFLMGALVGPVQNAVYNRGWKAVQRMKDPAEFARIKREQEERTNMVVNAINKMDPKQYFNALETNMVTQLSLDRVMNEAEDNNDPKEFHNAKSDSMFNHFHALLQTGNFDYFVDRLNDLKKLSPSELQELSNNAPLANSSNKSKDMYERIDAVVARAKQVQQRYKEVNERFTDDPDIFQYSQAKSSEEYRELLVKRHAYMLAKKHAIYANYGFDDALRRMSSIMDDIATINKPLAKVDSSKFSILFSKTQTREEIGLLRDEAVIYETGTLEQKKKATIAKNRLEKLERLSADQDHYHEIYKDHKKKPTKKSAADLKEALKDFKKSYYEYVKFQGKEAGEIVIDSKIEPSFIGLRDYIELSEDAEDFGRSVNALHDPKNFYKVADRLKEVTKRQLDDAAKTALAAFEKYLDREDEHGLLNSIYDAGAFIGIDSIKDLKKGNLDGIKFFYVAEGHGEITKDSAYYKEKILPILKKFKLYKEEVRGQKETAEPAPEGEPKGKPESKDQTKAISDFEKALRKNNEYVIGIDPKDSRYYLIKDPDTGKIERFERVSSILPDDYVGPKGLGKDATIAGTHVDRIGRQFFINAGKIEYENSYTSEGGTKWSPKDLMGKKVFNELVEALNGMYDQYVTQGKMKILTTDGVLYDRERKVAGTVDIIAIAENGEVSIFDFKTMRLGKYNKYKTPPIIRGEVKRSLEEKHTDQLSAYDILLNNQYNIDAEDLKVIPFELTYNEDGYVTSIKKREDIEIDYNKEVEKLISRTRPVTPKRKGRPSKRVKQAGIEGNISINHVEDLVQEGDAKTIVKTEADHERFYGADGVYKTKLGNYVQIAHRGQIKIKGKDIVGIDDLKLEMSKDKFAKNQGFKNWRDYEDNAQYAYKKLVEGETVNLYDITYVDPKDLGITEGPAVQGEIIYTSAGNDIANRVASAPDVFINGDVILQKHLRTLQKEQGEDQVKAPENLNEVEDVFLDYYMSLDKDQKDQFKREIQDVFIRLAKPGKVILTRNWFAREIATEAAIITDRDLLVELFRKHGRKDPEKAADYALKYEKEGAFKNAAGNVSFMKRESLKKTVKKPQIDKADRIFKSTIDRFERLHPDMLDEAWEEFRDTDSYSKLSLNNINSLKDLIRERKKDLKKGVSFAQLKTGQLVKTKKGEVMVVIAKTAGKVKLKNINKKMEAPKWLTKAAVPGTIATVVGKRKAPEIIEEEEEVEDEDIEFGEEEMTDEEIAVAKMNTDVADMQFGEEESEEVAEERVSGIKKAIKNPSKAQANWVDYMKNCAGKPKK